MADSLHDGVWDRLQERLITHGGPPDDQMVAEYARWNRRLRIAWTVGVVLALITIAVGLIGLIVFDWPWWSILCTGAVLAMLGGVTYVSDPSKERQRPDTPLETAMVVGSDVVTWGNADGMHRHTIRVVALGTDGILVHGYRKVPASSGVHAVPGTTVRYRRFPGLRHLVWLEDEAAEAGEPAIVTSVALGAASGPAQMEVTVEAQFSDGATLTDRSIRFPEEIVRLQPGTEVTAVRERANYLDAAVPGSCRIIS